jgi:hypothetical protein
MRNFLSRNCSLTFIAVMILMRPIFVWAFEVRGLNEVGVHQQILSIEKSRHPQNILVVYTKVDEKCQFIVDSSNRPVFDFYWLLNRTSYKPLNSTLKSEIEKRIELRADSAAGSSKSFYVSLNDLETINHDIPDPRLKVTSVLQDNKCSTQSLMQLGPSDHNAMVRVDSFYGESVGYLRPRIISVTLKGVNVETGAAIVRTYKAK